jgi:hypothetical protein
MSLLSIGQMGEAWEPFKISTLPEIADHWIEKHFHLFFYSTENWIRDWVSTTAGMDALNKRKSCAPTGIRTQGVQTVTSRYKDYATWSLSLHHADTPFQNKPHWHRTAVGLNLPNKQ